MTGKNIKWGLVLAGGGTKGSYHIGAWKALRELGIEVSAVCGTSIGAVNGALVALDEYDLAARLWSDIELDDVVTLSEDVPDRTNLFKLKNMLGVAADIYKNKGIDFSPFENMLNQYIDEDKLRKSNIDFGLVTFNISEGKTVRKFISDIPEGKLTEYITASASFPGMKPKKIDNKLFVDGGVTDNMPVEMLIDKGYDNIIAVDIGGIGVVRGVNAAGKNIIKVFSSQNLVGILDFEEDAIQKNFTQGYLDTLKAFGKLYGFMYYFKVEDYFEKMGMYSVELIEGIERAAKIFGIGRFRIYSTDELIELVMKAFYSKSAEIDTDIFKLKNEQSILCTLAGNILRGNTALLNNKLISSLGVDAILAARAVAYFAKVGKE